MPGLLSGQTRLWTRGQVKPQGVPRINWQHPLAAGLVFYGFDLGNGLILDLTTGRPMILGGGTQPTTVASPWGTAINWTPSNQVKYFTSDALIRAVSAAPPYTVATACVPTDTTQSNGIPFGRSANNNSSPFMNWGFQDKGSGTMLAVVNSAGGYTQVGSTLTYSANAFLSLALVATSSSAAAFYANGAATGSSTGLSIQSVNSGDGVGFSGNNPGTTTAQWDGLVFYGAFWSRALSQSEALLLHTDPYCFLLPESEMPAIFSPPVTGMALNEVTTATDAGAETLVAAPTLAEATSAADTVSYAISKSSAVNETTTATDTLSPSPNDALSIAESVAATDTLVSTLAATATIAEKVTATDTVSVPTASTLNEVAAATDTISYQTSPFSASIHELAPAVDGLRFALHGTRRVQSRIITAKVGIPYGLLQIPQTGV